MAQVIVNGCIRANGLANPSGPGRFPLIRRCRLLIGLLPNLVGSALPEGKSAAVAATGNTQTGSLGGRSPCESGGGSGARPPPSLRLSSCSSRACASSSFFLAISSSITFSHSLLIGSLREIGRRIDDGVDGSCGVRMIVRSRRRIDAPRLHGAGRRLHHFPVQRGNQLAAPDGHQESLETYEAGLVLVPYCE